MLGADEGFNGSATKGLIRLKSHLAHLDGGEHNIGHGACRRLEALQELGGEVYFVDIGILVVISVCYKEADLQDIVLARVSINRGGVDNIPGTDGAAACSLNATGPAQGLGVCR